jgi:hypothetical protein
MKFRVEQRGERQAEQVPFAAFGVASGNLIRFLPKA